MPSKEQNYANLYFSSIFPKAVRLLQESDVLVIVGYSLSEEDALLRFLIRQFAEDLRDAHGKSIFYVDYTDADVLEEPPPGLLPLHEPDGCEQRLHLLRRLRRMDRPDPPPHLKPGTFHSRGSRGVAPKLPTTTTSL